MGFQGVAKHCDLANKNLGILIYTFIGRCNHIDLQRVWDLTEVEKTILGL